LELGEVVEGMGRDLSNGGVGFLASQPPSSELCYLHWPESSQVAHLAVLARVIYAQPVAGHRYEIGTKFEVKAP
jgi:hypothetical protein